MKKHLVDIIVGVFAICLLIWRLWYGHKIGEDLLEKGATTDPTR